MRASLIAVLLLALCAGCNRNAGEGAGATEEDGAGAGRVTVTGDDSVSGARAWTQPTVNLAEDDEEAIAQARERAGQALAAGRLFEGDDAAIPLYLALQRVDADDREAARGLQQARKRLLEEAGTALGDSGEHSAALARARELAAVARTVWPDEAEVETLVQAVETAGRVWQLNHAAEQDLARGRLGESGEGALPKVRQALALEPGQPRAMQNLAAVESALIRRAEQAADAGDFSSAAQWLDHAALLRPEMATVADARARIDRMRALWVVRLRDRGIAALAGFDGIERARKILAELLLVAQSGDPAAAELRQRIDMAVHYGLFRPGQRFTDALSSGGRGPALVVVPHGAFSMGAGEDEAGATDSERPRRNIRFDRGFALSATEVTVGQFRRFIEATGHRTRASRRGYSMVYDELSGNFVRRSGVDWQFDYRGQRAGDNLPVLHVTVQDATAYAEWLAAESGQRYRLPSEAEFEYALRAGAGTTYPWGDGGPPEGAGNLTGGEDRSPSGRSWTQAFAGYGDGHWGPAPVASFPPNSWGLHDLSGNVSEWVADCWHENYRRAPADGTAWVNPGCRTHVIRGSAWSSAPLQTRSAWRSGAGRDTTNALIGFRVARDI